MFSNNDQTSHCPFNSSHTFTPQKFIFHINRCKDRKKVQHLFAKCKYDAMHFVKKEDLQNHELSCPKGTEFIKIKNKLKGSYEAVRKIREERERSREKHFKKEQEQEQFPEGKHSSVVQNGTRSVKRQENQLEQECLLEDCQQCQVRLKKYIDIIKKGGNSKLTKYLIKYNQLQ